MKALTIKEILTLTSLLIVAINMAACSPSTVMPSAINSTDLGQSESIIGGSIVSSADAIAQSTVILLDTDKGALCTGNIIAANLILTAAHCTQIHPEKIIVVFSARMPQSSQDLQKMVWRRIIGGKTTSAWPQLTQTKEKEWGDLAILKFEGTVPAGYKAAKLLARKEALRNGMTVTLAGYGITDGAKQTETDVLRKVDVTLADAKFSSTEFLMDQRQGRGACHGDSGGPAIVKVAGADVLVGITSRGSKDPQDTCLQFSVYTSVAANMSWIKKTSTELTAASFKGGLIAQPAGM